MEWTCARCGQLAEETTWTGLTDLGWRLNEGGDCSCADCTMRQWPATGRALALGEPRATLRLSPPVARRAGHAAPRPDVAGSASRAAASRPRPHLALVK